MYIIQISSDTKFGTEISTNYDISERRFIHIYKILKVF